jgi:hypothetical protein
MNIMFNASPLIFHREKDAMNMPNHREESEILEKRTPTDPMPMGATLGLSEPNVHRNQLFYYCKPDAKKKPPLTAGPRASEGGKRSG